MDARKRNQGAESGGVDVGGVDGVDDVDPWWCWETVAMLRRLLFLLLGHFLR